MVDAQGAHGPTRLPGTIQPENSPAASGYHRPILKMKFKFREPTEAGRELRPNSPAHPVRRGNAVGSAPEKQRAARPEPVEQSPPVGLACHGLAQRRACAGRGLLAAPGPKLGAGGDRGPRADG